MVFAKPRKPLPEELWLPQQPSPRDGAMVPIVEWIEEPGAPTPHSHRGYRGNSTNASRRRRAVEDSDED